MTDLAAIVAELSQHAEYLSQRECGGCRVAADFMYQARDALQSQAQEREGWVKGHPTREGVYAVAGYEIGRPRNYAVVEVRQHKGELWTNMHRENSNRDIADDWSAVVDCSERFKWLRLSDLPAAPTGGSET